jgi:hypothetical protein
MALNPKSSRSYETKDIHFGILMACAGLLWILLGASLLISRRVQKALAPVNKSMGADMSPMADMHRLPPEPRLQVSPPLDMIRLRDVEDVRLNNYSWIDPDAGQVRIPIARAMALIVERGLPARQNTEARP